MVGCAAKSPPLLWVLKGARLVSLNAPSGSNELSIKAYLGSVTWWRSRIVATAPRGNQYWAVDPRLGDALFFTLPDVCGLAVGGEDLWISSGHGVLGIPGRTITTSWAFDNYMAGG